MKLSELKGEAVIVASAEILELVEKMREDEKCIELAKSDKKFTLAAHILKNYPKEIINILAALNESTPEEFKDKITLNSIPKMLAELIGDDDIADLFKSQGQTGAAKSSGSASANAEM